MITRTTRIATMMPGMTITLPSMHNSSALGAMRSALVPGVAPTRRRVLEFGWGVGVQSRSPLAEPRPSAARAVGDADFNYRPTCS